MKKKINFKLLILLFLASCSTIKLNTINPSNQDNVKTNVEKIKEYTKELKEYSKLDLMNNTILFETTKEECKLGIRKTHGETCGNVRKVLIDIYKKLANINRIYYKLE